jgi:hypothetical protein
MVSLLLESMGELLLDLLDRLHSLLRPLLYLFFTYVPMLLNLDTQRLI